MSRSTQHPWLNRFAWLTASATFLLIGLGGLVTSHEAGMAVPDWPTTYGYNMFVFPFHLWTGGIFYEHTHRLWASTVGFLTIILAVWLGLREPRAWVRRLGYAAVFAVILQGVLGGLRVTLYKDEIGIFHAALGQVFFVLLTLTALFTSGWHERFKAIPTGLFTSKVRTLIALTTIVIFVQLLLGATMRHQHAGLAVPDFPLAYGQLWPRTDAAFIDSSNQQRIGVQDFKPITALQIYLHMAHRIGALLIMAAVATLVWVTRRQPRNTFVGKWALGWFSLIFLQALLGAATVWTNKAADVATTHVLVGALSLCMGVVFTTAACFGVAVRKPASNETAVATPSLRVVRAAV